jgi:hypothetical protein
MALRRISITRVLVEFEVRRVNALLYEESLAATLPTGRAEQVGIREESTRAHRLLQRIQPEPGPRSK